MKWSDLWEYMNRDFNKDNRGKKIRSYLLEPLINPRKAIVDHPQELEEEEDLSEEEEEVMDVDDSPKAIKEEERKPFDKSKIKCYNF